MFQQGWRDSVWTEMEKPWDLVIIGGGITGAGLFHQAVKYGLRTLLVEGADFASGTSSRSSKLVHGGIRYLRNRQYGITYESIRERQRLLKEASNLVIPLKFILTNRKNDRSPSWKYGLGVLIYDLMVPRWKNSYYTLKNLTQIAPELGQEGLEGAYSYYDALVDDARLVLRNIQEAVASGGFAINYAWVSGLIKDRQGQVRGVVIRDHTAEGYEREKEVQANVIVNATGPAADGLRLEVGGSKRIRKCRGSHILFPWKRFPIKQAFTLKHPFDNRVLFAIPWEGVTMIGTTDLDHTPDQEEASPEPCITSSEVEYLLEAVRHTFQPLGLTEQDIVSTFAGLRPIVSAGLADPSKESRRHVILEESGLLSVIGGKLTIYRLMAEQVLDRVRIRLPGRFEKYSRMPLFDRQLSLADTGLEMSLMARLAGRYGMKTKEVIDAACYRELSTVGDLQTTWAELRWAARAEGAQHLDDILLRRTRLGLLLERGGLENIQAIRQIVQPELGWKDDRWFSEVERYQNLWKACYYLPATVESVPQGELQTISV